MYYPFLQASLQTIFACGCSASNDGNKELNGGDINKKAGITQPAFIVSIFVIKFLMEYIKKHDFKVFGWYRIIFGAILLVYFLL